MKILVTGCAGYIGSQICPRLINNGYEVVGVDNFSTGKAENIAKGVTFFHGDLLDDSLYKQLPDDISYVIHLAAQSGGDKSFDDVLYDLSSNAELTIKLLSFCIEAKVKRILFSSSMAVYGDSDLIVTEKSRTLPKTFYGNSKLAAENYIRIYSENSNLEYVNLRLFNVYGPNQDSKGYTQGIVSIFLQQALNNKKILVKGSPNRMRDFVHVEDVIQAFLICMKSGLAKNKTFNVGFGKSYKVEELIKGIVKRLSFKPEIEYRGNTRGDIDKIIASIDSITRLGYRPAFDLDAGLDSVFAALDIS